MSDQMPTIRVLGFKLEYKADKTPVEWVEYAPISAIMTTRVWERVKKLRPPEQDFQNDDEGKKMAFMRHRWAMIEPAYDAWKAGQDIPIDGTPLAAWPGITSDQAIAIQRLGLRTVEEVAAMTDSMVTKLPIPNPRELARQAKAFLEASDRGAAAKRVVEQESRIAALEEQLTAAMELLEESSKAKPKRTAKPVEADAELEEVA